MGEKKKTFHSVKCPCNEHIKVQTEFFSDFVKKLQNSKSKKKQTTLLSKVNPCFFRYLSHCASGVLQGDIKLSKQKLKEIASEKKLLIKLVRPSVSFDKKREYFINEQKGGFLGILAGIAASALSSILGSQIAKLF
jgi:hypothetical protein